MKNDGRVIEKYNNKKREWEVIDFENLHKNDVFRIFDNGKRYINKADGNNVWIATNEPFLNDDSFWSIDTLY